MDDLQQLEYLNLSNNRISDITDFEVNYPLSMLICVLTGEGQRLTLPFLKYISISGNPVNRVRYYRYKLLQFYRNLVIIDGVSVAAHEKERSLVC